MNGQLKTFRQTKKDFELSVLKYQDVSNNKLWPLCVQHVHSLAKTLDSGGQTDVIHVYLYMAKAFDPVPHEKVVYKLEMIGLRNPLLAWIKDYLTNRRYRVIIEGTASDWKPVT